MWQGLGIWASVFHDFGRGVCENETKLAIKVDEIKGNHYVCALFVQVAC